MFIRKFIATNNNNLNPLSDVPVRFFLDGPTLGEIPECLPSCSSLLEITQCNARINCEVINEDGVEQCAEISTLPEGIDSRCSVGQRCEANRCIANDRSPLPLSLSPLNTLTDTNGVAALTLTTGQEAGIFSIRAVALFEDMTQELLP